MADKIVGTRQDTWAVQLWVNGSNFGIWDTLTGGEKDSDATSYKPGNMGDPYSLGGWPTLGNVVLSRNYRLVRDHDQALPLLLAAAGDGDVTVYQWPLDKSKKPYNKAIKRTGTLKRVTPPPVDSKSSDAAMVEVEIVLDGDITTAAATLTGV